MKCTYCGSEEWIEGPRGGIATNVLCANKECRHWFNVSPLQFEDLHRVEPSDEEKEDQRRRADVAAHNLRHKTWQEGVMLFQQGQSALSCIKSQNNNEAGFYSAAGDDIVRLAGWLDAMQERLKHLEGSLGDA